MPSISFAIKQENIDYIISVFGERHRNKSHWLDDLIDHLRCKNSNSEKPAVKKQKTYPANLSECFDSLWLAKGRKGSKQKALIKFKTYCVGESEDNVKLFTEMLIENIASRNKTELGAPEQHLTTYLNGEFWDV